MHPPLPRTHNNTPTGHRCLRLLFSVGQTSPTTVSQRPPQWPYARMRRRDGSTERWVVTITARDMALLKHFRAEIWARACVLLLAFSHHGALPVDVNCGAAIHLAWLQC